MKLSTLLLLSLFPLLNACDDDDDSQPVTDAVSAFDGATDAVSPDVAEPDVARLDGTPADGEVQPDAQADAGTDDPDAALPPLACGDNGFGFVADYEEGILNPKGAQYYAQADRAGLVDVMYVRYRGQDEAPLSPGLYDLTDSNLEDCTFCVFSLEGCNPQTGECTKIYYADEGQVEVTAVGNAVGESFAGRFRGVKLKEVDVDEDTNHSTLVEGGEAWCANDYTFDVELKPTPARVGEIIHDFELQNCETGEMKSLSAMGQESKGLWLIAVAGWCSACRQFIPQVIDMLEGVSKSKIQVVFVLGEDNREAQPTLDYCKQYARRYEDDASRFYLDHDGRSSYATLFSHLYIYPGPEGEFGLPWNALVKGASLVYLYADGAGEGDLETLVNGFLD